MLHLVVRFPYHRVIIKPQNGLGWKAPKSSSNSNLLPWAGFTPTWYSTFLSCQGPYACVHIARWWDQTYISDTDFLRREAGSWAKTLHVPQHCSSLPRNGESCWLKMQAPLMVPQWNVTRVNRVSLPKSYIHILILVTEGIIFKGFLIPLEAFQSLGILLLNLAPVQHRVILSQDRACSGTFMGFWLLACFSTETVFQFNLELFVKSMCFQKAVERFLPSIRKCGTDKEPGVRWEMGSTRDPNYSCHKTFRRVSKLKCFAFYVCITHFLEEGGRKVAAWALLPVSHTERLDYSLKKEFTQIYKEWHIYQPCMDHYISATDWAVPHFWYNGNLFSSAPVAALDCMLLVC